MPVVADLLVKCPVDLGHLFPTFADRSWRGEFSVPIFGNLINMDKTLKKRSNGNTFFTFTCMYIIFMPCLVEIRHGLNHVIEIPNYSNLAWCLASNFVHERQQQCKSRQRGTGLLHLNAQSIKVSLVIRIGQTQHISISSL